MNPHIRKPLRQPFDRARLPDPLPYYAAELESLRGHGRSATARCPFHDDQHPSLIGESRHRRFPLSGTGVWCPRSRRAGLPHGPLRHWLCRRSQGAGSLESDSMKEERINATAHQQTDTLDRVLRYAVQKSGVTSNQIEQKETPLGRTGGALQRRCRQPRARQVWIACRRWSMPTSNPKARAATSTCWPSPRWCSTLTRMPISTEPARRWQVANARSTPPSAVRPPRRACV
jgi:hypothetical protein